MGQFGKTSLSVLRPHLFRFRASQGACVPTAGSWWEPSWIWTLFFYPTNTRWSSVCLFDWNAWALDRLPTATGLKQALPSGRRMDCQNNRRPKRERRRFKRSIFRSCVHNILRFLLLVRLPWLKIIIFITAINVLLSFSRRFYCLAALYFERIFTNKPAVSNRKTTRQSPHEQF